MKNIPTQTENPKGLHQRFHIEKLNGETDPKAEYFVLRLDSNGKDPNHINACRIGIQAYANAIEPFIPELANDLRERYPARQPVRKTLDRYDIDFGGNVMAGIEVEGQINIVGAMDGYGNGISLDKIIITPIAQAKAVEPQETPDAVELLKEYQSRLNEVYQNTGALTGIDVDYCLLLTLHDNGFKIETPTQTNNLNER